MLVVKFLMKNCITKTVINYYTKISFAKKRKFVIFVV